MRKAAWMVRDGTIIERYSTLFDDTAEIPYGLGCGGVVDLLLEPVDTPECRALLGAMEASLGGGNLHIVTWLPEEGGPLRRAVFAEDGNIVFASAALTSADIDAACAAIDILGSSRNSSLSDQQAAQHIYVERLAPPQRLIVLGAGEDAKPVVTLASLLGWRVVVVDGRAQLANPARFPEAERVLATSSLTDLSLRTDDAVILMTHSYEQDRTLLAQLLAPLDDREPLRKATRSIPGYIGLLGAAHRSSLLIAEAAATRGVDIAACCEHVWAPVGLDLGGDGAEAIALAIIAEVQAHVQGRLPTSRKLTPERVAEHIAQGGAARYLEAHCALDSVDATAK